MKNEKGECKLRILILLCALISMVTICEATPFVIPNLPADTGYRNIVIVQNMDTTLTTIWIPSEGEDYYYIDGMEVKGDYMGGSKFRGDGFFTVKLDGWEREQLKRILDRNIFRTKKEALRELLWRMKIKLKEIERELK